VGEPAEDALPLLERLVAVDERRLPIERLDHPAIIAVTSVVEALIGLPTTHCEVVCAVGEWVAAVFDMGHGG
jgi:hypothetical protein